MEEFSTTLTGLGKTPKGVNRVVISKKDSELLIKKYTAFQLKIGNKIVPVKVRSDRRIEIPTKVVEELGIEKGEITFEVVTFKELKFEERVIQTRKIQRIARRSTLTRTQILNFPLPHTIPKELLRQYITEINRFLVKSYKKLDRKTPNSSEFYARLVVRMDGDDFPSNTKVVTTNMKPLSDDRYGNRRDTYEKGGGIKYLIKRIEIYVLNAYGYALFYRDKEIILWEIQYISRKLQKSRRQRNS